MKLRLLLLALTIFACSSCVKEISTEDPDIAWKSFTSYSAREPKKGTFEVLNTDYYLKTDKVFGYTETAYFKIIANQEWINEFKIENSLDTDRISEHGVKEIMNEKHYEWFNVDTTYTVLSFWSGMMGYLFQKEDTIYIYYRDF